MTEPLPAVIARYLQAADEHDARAVVDCFTDDGVVVDEGHTYRGHDEILRWRETTAVQWEYTTTIVGDETGGPREHVVHALLDGDFPGGHAELVFRFTLRDGLVAALTIAG